MKLISDSINLAHIDIVLHQKKSSLTTIDCDLADELIKALLVEFLPDRADTSLPGLALG